MYYMLTFSVVNVIITIHQINSLYKAFIYPLLACKFVTDEAEP